MTLLVNELRILDSFDKAVWVVAADRRITLSANYHETRQKLFKVPYLCASVSYFGLSAFDGSEQKDPTTGKVSTTYKYLADWLPDFINKHSDIGNLQEFVALLRKELLSITKKEYLRGAVSGFHISGFNEQGYPVFWFFCNASNLDPNTLSYNQLHDTYGEPHEDFLSRDAKALGWDGADVRSCGSTFFIYRNGDIRLHPFVQAFDALFTGWLSRFRDFEIPDPRKFDDYADYVDFKFKIISYIYKRWAKVKNIAPPIDVLVLPSPALDPDKKCRSN